MLRDPLQRICKTFFCNSESDTEMLRHSEAVAWCQERPAFSDSATELARIAAVLQPRETNHPATRTNPTDFIFPLRKKLIEKTEVVGDRVTRTSQNFVAVTKCNYG